MKSNFSGLQHTGGGAGGVKAGEHPASGSPQRNKIIRKPELFVSFFYISYFHSTHHVSMASFDFSPVRMWIQFQRWSIVRVVWIEFFILLHVPEHIYEISNKSEYYGY